jgi:hypothetical protein
MLATVDLLTRDDAFGKNAAFVIRTDDRCGYINPA